MICCLVLAAQESELRRRVRDLEEFVSVRFPPFLVQITGEGKEHASVGKQTIIELTFSSQANLLIPFSIKQLSFQLTDPRHQCVPCSITSTHPEVCTVTYTPTLRGTHQLRIAINETDIPGSPLTVHVLPSAIMKHKISGLKRPWGVALSKSGELVVSKFNDHRVSVYTNEWKIIRSFGFYESGKGQFQYPHSVAITSDNRILVADSENYRIQMHGRQVFEICWRAWK